MIEGAGKAGINIIRAEDSKKAKIEDVLIVGKSSGNPPNATMANGDGIWAPRADWIRIENV